MSKKEAKLIYDSMLMNGELTELFPDLTGNWLEDKKSFMAQYNSNQEFLEGGLDLDFDNLLD